MSSLLRILAVPVTPRSPASFCSSGSSLPDKPVPRRLVAVPSGWLLLSLTKGPSLERYAGELPTCRRYGRWWSACPLTTERDVWWTGSQPGQQLRVSAVARARLMDPGMAISPIGPDSLLHSVVKL